MTIVELVEFLTPQTRSDIRRKALEYVVGYSGTIDEPTARLFTNNDYMITEAICKLCETSVSDRSEALCILTNCSSGSVEVADFILSRSRCAQLAFDASRSHERYMDFAAHLLANLSRHFPDKVNDISHGFAISELFSSSPENSFACLIGYTLVNLSTLCSIRYLLVDSKRLSRICSLTVVEKKKEVAADILRNLAFEDALHSTLVDDESDMYLVSLLIPLADCSDKLSDDEIEKLPLRLQYYEGTREKSVQMRQKLIEALYQLCSTRTSREYLRKRGVYALLRELDQATEEDTHQKSHTEHTLHALIAVLIRDEDEISRDSNFESLRSLS
uniref:Protein HGH1 homolog n=1 Tax=Angiostrongylus cantonensis TaxID=6313 RepID=A0A0K0DLQ9_ANGCA